MLAWEVRRLCACDRVPLALSRDAVDRKQVARDRNAVLEAFLSCSGLELIAEPVDVEPGLLRELLVDRLLAPEKAQALLGLDQPVVAVAPAVDDVDRTDSAFRNTKKSWPTSSSWSTASSGVIGLTANCFVFVIARCVVELDRKFLGRWRRVAAGSFTALFAVTLHLALELVHELVDRRLDVRRGLARAQHRALRPDGRLGDVVVGDGRVLLDGELELDPVGSLTAGRACPACPRRTCGSAR